MKLPTPFVVESPEEVLIRKKLFAEKLLQNPSDPFAVALQVVPETAAALRAATEWPADLDVIAHQQHLIRTLGKAAFLPDQDDTARLADDMARGRQPASMERI